ncbi:MAG TPA: hypothetical protein VJN18_31105 [Polyangiaceae bacterium]|nr:hypothetical protein [Polyangiaceae bacterium]
MTTTSSLSPVVKYHGLALRHLLPPRFLTLPRSDARLRPPWPSLKSLESTSSSGTHARRARRRVAGRSALQRSGPLFGFEFLDEFEQTTSLIRETPLLSTLVDPPIRRALIYRFPYGVFVVPGLGADADVIVAVVDLHQDPEVIRRAYRR